MYASGNGVKKDVSTAEQLCQVARSFGVICDVSGQSSHLNGTGIGPGTGSGLGPGFGLGPGSNAFRPGNGVSPPTALYVPKPQYTVDAMRARVQGSVLVECIVQTTGQCTQARIVRSLDPTFGLDQEALKAAQQFRFKPGTRMGEAVPVSVTIELNFSLDGKKAETSP